MNKTLEHLPRPKGTPIWGHTIAFSQDPLGFLTHCGREYGEIVPLRFGAARAFLLIQPAHIEQVLKEQRGLTKNSPAWNALKTLVGEGLLTSDGEFWARQRRLMQPVFHQQRITGYGETMVAYTEALLQTWQDGEIRDIHHDMMQLTLNIVTKTLFNVDMQGTEAQTVAHALDVAMEWFLSRRKQAFLPLAWIPTPMNQRYKKALQDMDQVLYQLIQQRRQSQEKPGDLLSMLIAVKDEVDGSQMSDLQLRNELATLMLAGHETTANALSWSWMLLAEHPDVYQRLIQELDTVLAGRSPTVADLPRLPYCHWVIKESMRLYPPVFSIARTTANPYNLAGYSIPANSILIFSPWVMHRSDRYFVNPEQFQPERWANDLEKQLPKGVYFPFGDGARICIGKGFALMEAVLLLATIAQNFQLTLVPDHPIALFPSITLRPQYGLKMTVTARSA
ncbi:MAG: cytochrome P450 [Elainellaceae cyanobacterium]